MDTTTNQKIENFNSQEWFTLENIEFSDNTEDLYCISVDSPEKQFLIGEHLAVPTHNSDEARAEDEMKGEAAMIIGSIARLGRAAGVHLVIATQRPDAKIISGETKANLGVRINAGRTDSNASSMILGSGDGMRVKSNPRGRLYLRIFSSGNHGQGFFAQQSWIDDWLEKQGKNPDGSPLSQKRSRLANVADMSQFAEGDLDEREGVDNAGAIDQIRQEEANESFDELMSDNQDSDDMTFDDSSDDWDFEEVDDEPVEDDKLGRPDLAGTPKDDPRLKARPEESWDLDDLLEENED